MQLSVTGCRVIRFGYEKDAARVCQLRSLFLRAEGCGEISCHVFRLVIGGEGLLKSARRELRQQVSVNGGSPPNQGLDSLGHHVNLLKDKLERKLNIARAAAAQKRIADADIGRHGNRQKADAASRERVNAVRARVYGEAGQERR
ncbi:MAG: hypothetical protein QOD00_2015 [Blastocatellia bacterium]|nr:hypothetical protein [Blastocatellia bacterium]